MCALLVTFTLANTSTLPAYSAEFQVKEGANVNLRSGPGTSYKKAGRLKSGSRLEELERNGNWSKVRTEDGDIVWVHNGYIVGIQGKKTVVPSVPGKLATKILPQTQHTSQVAVAEFGANDMLLITSERASRGKSFLSGKDASTSKLWLANNGILISEVLGNAVNGTATISPDGRFVAKKHEPMGLIHGLWYKNVDVIDLETGAQHILEGAPLPNLFSDDSRTIATFLVPEGEVRIYRTSDFSLVHSLSLDDYAINTYAKIEISPDHASVLLSDGYDAVIVSTSSLSEIGRLEGPLPQFNVAIFRFSPGGNYIYAFDRDGSIGGTYFWHASSFQKVSGMQHWGEKLRNFAWSSGDKLVAINFQHRSIIWDMEINQIVRDLDEKQLRFGPERYVGFGISGFSWDGSKFLTHGNAAVWDVDTGKAIRRFGKVGWVSWRKDGLFLFERTGKIVKYDPTNYTPEFEFGNGTSFEPVKFVGWASDTELTTVNVKEIRESNSIKDRLKTGAIWNRKNGSVAGVITREKLVSQLENLSPDKLSSDSKRSFTWISPDARYVIGENPMDRHEYPSTTPLKNGRIQNEFKRLQDTWYMGQDIRYNAEFGWAVAETRSALNDQNGSSMIIRLWDIKSGAKINEISFGRRYSAVDHEISRNGKVLVASLETRDSGQTEIRSWSLPEFEELSSVTSKLKIDDLMAVDNTGTIGVTHDSFHSFILHDLKSGTALRNLEKLENGNTEYQCVFCANQPLAAFSNDNSMMLGGSDSGIVGIWDIKTGSVKKKFLGHTSGVYSVAWSEDDKLILTGSDDGSARIWRVKDQKEMLRLYVFGGGDWVALTPEGYFNSSKNGANSLIAVSGVNAASMDKFYNSLYRPDLVLEALRGDPADKVKKAGDKLDLAQIWLSGPAPLVISFASLEGATVDVDKISVVADLKPVGGGIGRVEIKVNGATQVIENLPEGAEGGDSVKISQAVFLTPGKNQIEVTAYNNANLIASDSKTIEVESTAKLREKPTLHILTVGVNKYEDDQITELNYAVADAIAIGQAFTKSAANVYENVNVTRVFDSDATKDNLDQVFNKLGSEARPEDVFVFFLSGHGKTKDGRYYFIPPDFEYEGPQSFAQNGIGQLQWQQWMARVPAQKSILLYDTCESGSLARDQANEGLEVTAAINRLTRATGRTILTAATDTEPALEGYGGHGVFSYLVLEALGVADTDKDGQLEVTELASHIETELPEVSYKAFRHRQIPQISISGYSFSLGTPSIVLEQSVQ